MIFALFMTLLPKHIEKINFLWWSPEYLSVSTDSTIASRIEFDEKIAGKSSTALAHSDDSRRSSQ
jgi:hypothetical protein